MRITNWIYSITILVVITLGFSLKSVHAQCSGEVLNISAPTPSQTGTSGNWTVPSGGPYKVKITAKGAKGGDASNYAGGAGASLIGEFIVNSGELLNAIAGAPGANSPAGNYMAGGGGGGSGVQLNNGVPLILAGGGGGAIYRNYGFGTGGGCGQVNNNGSQGGTTDGGGGGGGGFVGNGTNGSGLGGGGGFGGLGGNGESGEGGSGGGGFGGGGGGAGGFVLNGGGGGGGYSGGNGNSTGIGGIGGGSLSMGSNQSNIICNNNAGGQVIIECLGAATFTANFTPTQPFCANPTLGSLSIDLTGDLNGDTRGLEYAIVSGNSFSGTPTFADITADPFNITSGFGTSGDFDGETYTVRIRLKYNPDLFLDNTYTLTAPCNCTFYVNDDATGSNNGTSWANAFTSLQSALAAACSGAQIWVAAGTYKPTTGTDRNISFSMKNDVTIYGGFNGTETMLSERDWVNNVTILSGDLGIPGDYADNSYTVVANYPGINNTAIIDGFTISGGNANGVNLVDQYTGGMRNWEASPTIRNCIFSDNIGSAAGAGIVNYSSASSTIINCIFINNTGQNVSAGIINFDGGCTITNCTFSGNNIGMYNLSATSVTVNNSVFWGNTLHEIHNSSSNPVVSNSIIAGGYPGVGNLDADPLFIDSSNGNLRLSQCSPAVNAGDNTAVPSGITTDLDGNARFYDNGIVDMGAYEYQGTYDYCTTCLTSGNVVYVNDDASGANNGKNWVDAFTNLQDALALANSCSNVSEIWVAAGTYYPTSGTDRSISFVMKNNLAIYGGFNGTETQLSERDWVNNVAILSGDIGTAGDNSDNSFHVIYNDGNWLNNTAILDGFTITAGFSEDFGGGMYNYNSSSPTLNNCSFSGNFSISCGGGIYNGNTSSPTLNNCSFSGNSASSGGGMFNYINSSPALNNCSFSGNSASGDGGGIVNEKSSSPELINCTFFGNSTNGFGGGIRNGETCSPQVINCSFFGNSANLIGGAMWNSTSSNPMITNCILWGNSSEIYNSSGGNSSVSYSIVQGGYTGTGNLDINPLFVNEVLGDLRLQPCSPAINAGDNSAVPSGITTDLDGNPRFYDNGIVDMGAYEYQGEAVSGNVIFVNDDASGNNDGTSWTDAFTDLQDALALAGFCSNITEIWVAAGTYKPTTGTDRSFSFVMKNGVAVYGGFNGTETQLSERDWVANETILSGDLNGDDGSNFINYNDNSHHVVSGVADGIYVLDGLIVERGNSNEVSLGKGAGLVFYGNNQSVTISNCIIRNNLSNYRGAGVNISPTIIGATLELNVYNSFFLNNSAQRYSALSASAMGEVVNTVFADNQASIISMISASQSNVPFSFVNCTFHNNQTPNVFYFAGTRLIKNCIVTGSLFDTGNATISNSIVSAIPSGSIDGGGNIITASATDFFSNPSNLAGADNKFGTNDDGLALVVCSPAIDAGFDADNQSALDLTGSTRKFEAIPGGQKIDIGAYEFQGNAIPGPVVYVNDNASGNNDGTSWADAFTDLQDALALAGFCSNITEIWVAAGTYKPTTGTDRSFSFVMKNGVAIYGGFNGTETQLSERDWVTNETILSGDIGTGGDNADNSYHVVANNNNSLDASAILDGFIISGGNANGTAYSPESFGGGLLNYFSAPAIRNCKIENNHAVSGGGIYNFRSDAEFINCIVTGNTAGSNGGGMYDRSSIPFVPSPTLVQCIFYDNTATSGGGFYSSESSANLINSVIYNNTATNGGALYCNDGIPTESIAPTLTNSIIWGNSSGIASFDCSATVNYSVVEGGYAGTGNLDEDPLFIDAANRNLRLQPCSPAINAGDNAAVPSGITTDLDGNPRFYNSGTVDIGAFEYQGTPVTGSVVYVNDDASGNNDGSSWTDAFTDLQNALSLANSCSNVTEIWVAAGTYYPTSGTDRSISFVMKNNVAIYGGFNGTETQLSQRDWVNNETILSGDIGITGDNSDNSLHVILNDNNGLNNTAILDGFTITGGNANGGIPNSYGGGMFNINSSPSVSNCLFSRNSAQGIGGGMANYPGSPTVSNCIFSGNSANIAAGGMFNYTPSSPTVTNCIFSGNSAGMWGGAISSTGSSLTITNCSFSGNSAGIDGGVMLNNGSSPIITNCILWGNSSGMSNTNGGNPVITFSIVQGGFTGTGNLNVDPLFVSQPDYTSAPTTTGDLHLQQCSPAIDAGTNTGAPSNDLDGNTRPYNATGSATVDMGAYEYQSSYDVCTTCLTSGNVVYVNDDASGANNGKNWTDAFTGLQDALALANSCSNVSEIWVAAGTYKPTTGTDRSISFTMINGVAIYGGFNGTETQLSERDWISNVTILSGDIGVPNNNTDNCYHVIFNDNNGLDNSAILDGFTISGGNADLISDLSNRGGGILNNNSSPNLTNLIITGNFGMDGGGLYNLGSSPNVDNCFFIANQANFGGGNFNTNGSSPYLSNCTFRNNQAVNGGALGNFFSSEPTLTNCLVVNNSSTDGGGVYNYQSDITLINCSFSLNSASGTGDALFNSDCSPAIVNSIFWNNGEEISNINSSNPTINFSVVQGGYSGTGNLDEDPLFVDPANGDFHLQPCSPAINAGTNTGAPADDLDGNTRPYNPYSFGTAIVDIGAYEYSSPVDYCSTCEVAAVAGSLTKDPDEIAVCEGGDVSALLTAGTGGNGIDSLAYRTHDGSSWSGWANYTSGTTIPTTGLTAVEIHTQRLSTHCDSSEFVTINWVVEQTPVSGTLAKSPDATTVCEGSDVLAILSAGSGGNGLDSLVYRTNNGSSWSDWMNYSSGDNISTTGKTGVEILTLRQADHCGDASAETVSWNVDPTSVGGSVSGTTDITYGSSTGDLTLTGHTGSVVKWQKKLNFNGNWVDVANTSDVYSEYPSSPGTWYYRAQVQSGVCSEEYSQEHAVNVGIKELTIGGSFTANDKIYDDNTDATFDQNNLTLEGIVGSDDVSLTGLEIDFAAKTVGEHTVSITAALLDGADKDNYTLSLTGSPETTATIDAGPPVKFLVTNPDGGDISSPKLHNIPFDVKVTLVDAYDNPTPNTGGIVTVTLTGSGGATPGELRFQGLPSDPVTMTLPSGDTLLNFNNVLYTGVSDIAGFDVKVSASATGTGTANGKTGESNLFSVRDIFFGVEASPTSIQADGTSKSDITVTLLDHENNPISGEAITVETDFGTLMDGTMELTGVVSRNTDSNGQVFLQLRASTTSEVATVTAKCPGACPKTAEVAFLLSAPVITGFTPGEDEATMDFTPPGNVGTDAITNYEYSLNDGSDWTPFSPAQTTSPVTISGLTGGQTYPARLRAVNEAGTGEASDAYTIYSCYNPTDGGTIAADQDIVFCDQPAELTSQTGASGNFGTLEYQWQQSTTSETEGFSDIPGANSANYQPDALTDTTWFRRLARVSCKSDWTGAVSSNVVKLTLTFSQTIHIPKGWSYISSWLEPTNPNIINLWQEVVGANNLVILTGTAGIYAPPPLYINTLQTWDVDKGYKVKMNHQDDLVIDGRPLDDKSVTFPAGVHLIPVLTNQTTPLDEAFSNPANDILYLLDIYTNQVYWPDGQINTLTELVPGKGYLANFKNQVTLSYPELGDCSKSKGEPMPPADGPWPVVRTSGIHLISVSAEAMNGLQNADYIGAFDSQGNCVGYVPVEKSGKNLLLTVYGDEPITAENDGLMEGELLRFRSFSLGDNAEKELTATFNPTFPNADGLFVANGLSGISGFKESATVVGENDMEASVKVYPNPAKEFVTLTLTGFKTLSGLEKGLNGTLLTTEGKLVKTFSITSPTIQLDVSDLQTGIYLMKIGSADQIVVKRVVIQ